MFFLAWIGLAFATVAAIHIYLRFFSKRTISFGRAGYVTGLGGESCFWVNSVLKWLYVHLHQTPWLVQQWIEELNKTALQNTLKPGRGNNLERPSTKQLGAITILLIFSQGDVQVKFENIVAGSLPPKISNLSTNIEDSESLTVKADVEACDVAFLMTALQQTQSGVISANCELNIQRLTGQIYVISDMRNESMQLTASFVKVPDIKFIVKQRGFDTQIEPGRIETAVRRAISDTKVFWNVSLNSLNTNMQRPLTLNNQIRDSYQNTHAAYKYNSMDMRHEPNMDSYQTNEVRKEEEDVSDKASNGSTSVMPSSDRNSTVLRRPLWARNRDSSQYYPLNVAKTAIRDRKLLVKVIKATGVSDIDTGMSDPYCIVSMDEPAQKHSTSACKHTFNPFWDEHFLFDLNDATQQLRFELYDKSKNPGNDFLGRAFVMVDELRSTPGSRQILPLAGKPKGQGGSLTVEFLFVESNDNTAYNDLPRRHIDTTRTVSKYFIFLV
ncbi:DgyrCDS8961 [Dimorphilus gyrociliatus]|uniref:DgyrCDS8961 n=1 Tax=Dimorphilus gyrociliatus TaxID=2664684 RepID=A0A7I8VVN5_9ANNE|nr:DgyrCDS8961 [Dimorphilus gyrociliatus]